jgi:hypothetical protein
VSHQSLDTDGDTESTQTQSQTQTQTGMSSNLQQSTSQKLHRIENEIEELKGYLSESTDPFWVENVNAVCSQIHIVLQRCLSYHEMTNGYNQRNGTASSSD